MPAKFYEQDVQAKLKDKKALSAFLEALVQQHRPAVKKTTLNYIFCNDEYLLQINKQFLDHDTFTDIVTFDMSDDEKQLAGEIYVSTERVADNAAKFGTSYNHELHRVIFHGALHLCGFKDKKPADKKEMTRQEDICLQQYLK